MWMNHTEQPLGAQLFPALEAMSVQKHQYCKSTVSPSFVLVLFSRASDHGCPSHITSEKWDLDGALWPVQIPATMRTGLEDEISNGWFPPNKRKVKFLVDHQGQKEEHGRPWSCSYGIDLVGHLTHPVLPASWIKYCDLLKRVMELFEVSDPPDFSTDC